jgi:HK97 gp10 family phage protein
MTDITITLTGLDAALRKIEGAAAKIEAGAHDGLTAVAFMAQANAIRSVQKGPKTGIVYQLYNPKRTHQASAPGEAPATDLGGLAMSILVSVPLADRRAVELVADAPYAVHLEYGTRKMAARPFMRPAVEKVLPKAEKIVRAYVDAALKA